MSTDERRRKAQLRPWTQDWDDYMGWIELRPKERSGPMELQEWTPRKARLSKLWPDDGFIGSMEVDVLEGIVPRPIEAGLPLLFISDQHVGGGIRTSVVESVRQGVGGVLVKTQNSEYFLQWLPLADEAATAEGDGTVDGHSPTGGDE